MIKSLDAGERSCYVHGRIKPYSVAEASRATGIPRSSLYAACNRAEVPNTRVGDRFYIPASFVDRVIAGPQNERADAA